MPSPVAIDEVTHMDEFLADDDLDRSRRGNVDPGEVDQNGVSLMLAEIAIRATVVSGNPPPKPAGINCPVVGDPEIFGGEIQSGEVLIDECDGVDAGDLPPPHLTTEPWSPATARRSRPRSRSIVSIA